MAWLAGWTYRQKITINSNGISLSGNVSDMTIIVRIPSSNTDFWTNVNSDGGDVRFTQSDGSTLLYKATIKFDSTGDDALYLVKTSLDSVTDTDIYVYYKKTAATTDDDIANTLESDTQAYWPLDVNHASGAFADIASTNDGTNTGTTDAAGQVGQGRDFSGTAQYITCGTGMGLSGNRTIVASINGVHGAAALHAILAKYGTTNGSVQDFYLAIFQQKLRSIVTEANPPYAIKVTNGATTLSDNTTYCIGMSYDSGAAGNHLVVWLNGADDSDTTADTGTFTTTVTSAEPIIIGARQSGASGLYDGVIDEVAVYNTVKSADWWKAEYQSRLGTWLTFAAQENYTYSYTGSGGGIAGGTATQTTSFSHEGSGGGVAGGAADYLFDGGGYYTMSGGAIAGGSADVTTSFTHVASGGGIVGGTAPYSFTITAVTMEILWRIVNPSTDTLVTGGGANTKVKIRRTPDGYSYDWNDLTFKASGWTTLEPVMSEVDSTNYPGLYKKEVNIATFIDGWYQVYVDYNGTFKDYADAEFLISSGNLVDIKTATNLDAQVSAVNTNVSTRLAAADYTAPDNAGIAALQTLMASLDKWKNNKLARTSLVGNVETWVLYDDDSTTPLLTWTNNTTTRTRTKAT